MVDLCKELSWGNLATCSRRLYLYSTMHFANYIQFYRAHGIFYFLTHCGKTFTLFTIIIIIKCDRNPRSTLKQEIFCSRLIHCTGFFYWKKCKFALFFGKKSSFFDKKVDLKVENLA